MIRPVVTLHFTLIVSTFFRRDFYLVTNYLIQRFMVQPLDNGPCREEATLTLVNKKGG